MKIQLKRIYDEPKDSDGIRILVDRLWPRGVSRERAKLDFWAKEIAPSTELRQWFHQNDSTYKEFQRRYQSELEENKPAVTELLNSIDSEVITLLSSVKQLNSSHVPILAKFLEHVKDSIEKLGL